VFSFVLTSIDIQRFTFIIKLFSEFCLLGPFPLRFAPLGSNLVTPLLVMQIRQFCGNVLLRRLDHHMGLNFYINFFTKKRPCGNCTLAAR